MDQELIEKLQAAQNTLEPRFKDLRNATSALKRALKLASADKPDALPMNQVLLKLEQATTRMADEDLRLAAESFRQATEQALDALAFEFASDLREFFARRGVEIGGRPPTLVVDELILKIDIAARKAQWFYGKEPLTRKLPLSITTIVKAYEQQQKLILERRTDPDAFLRELFETWREELTGRSRQPPGGRLNLVEIYSKMILGRQSNRFWNAPSRSTFKDYPRPLFVRDLVLAQAAPYLEVDGKRRHLRLGVATKNQAENASRSIWLPNGALDGEYYADITFIDAP